MKSLYLLISDRNSGRRLSQGNPFFLLFVIVSFFLAYPSSALCNNFDLVKTIQGPQSEIISAVACSVDEKLIATGGADVVVSLWDLHSGKL